MLSSKVFSNFADALQKRLKFVMSQNKWDLCIKTLQAHLSEQAFRTWFAYLKFVSLDADKLVIGAPNKFVIDYIEGNYLALLQTSIKAHFGNVKVAYSFPKEGEAPRREKVEKVEEAPRRERLDPQLNRDYTFKAFVEGRANKLARVIGLAIAKEPGKPAFNPFFLYGPSGVGKTHLVNAIGLRILESQPERRVLYVPAHLFKTQYTDSVLHNTINDFIHFYQTIDVLIIDDIQEITTAKTQQAFFHIFNHLQQNGRQIIITCDRAPVDFEGIEERMLTRFKWGTVTEMEKPDVALRRAILTAKIKRDGLKFPPDVIDYIANNVESSVRELQGIVNSIMAYSVVDNCDICQELVEKVVARAVNLEKHELTLDDIVKAVCKRYNVKLKDVNSKSRKQGIVLARQLAMFLSHKYTTLPYSQIGHLIGRKDHSTVLHACNTISNRITTDKNFRREVEELESALK